MNSKAEENHTRREVANAIIEAFIAFNKMTPTVLIHDLSSAAGRAGESEDSLGMTINAGQQDPAENASKVTVYWAQWFRQDGHLLVDSGSLRGRLQSLIDCLALTLLALRRPRERQYPPCLTAPENIMSLLEDEDVLRWLATYGSPELISSLE